MSSSFVRKALVSAFAKTDADVQVIARKNGWRDGSCAVVALTVGDHVFIANVGDSKVLCFVLPLGWAI